jgi:S-adenosylmethionine decarboxylase
MIKALGRHIVAELSLCNSDTLSDIAKVRDIMVRGALAAKATVREVAFHKFEPGGVSGVVVLAESHLSIHTWPEYGYAAIDIYTCGDTADPWRACEYLAERFEAQSISTTVVERGIPTPHGNYHHTVAATARDKQPKVVQHA